MSNNLIWFGVLYIFKFILMEYTIESQRLKLVPFTDDDIPLFHQINTDPFVRRYLWDDKVIDLQTAEDIIMRNNLHFREDHYGLWKIHRKATAKVIGYAGLWYFYQESQPQLIYALLEEYTKKGYATEASQAIINYAFSQLGFQYLVAATDEPHIASQHVARRLGMRFVKQKNENGKPTMFFRVDR